MGKPGGGLSNEIIDLDDPEQIKGLSKEQVLVLKHKQLHKQHEGNFATFSWKFHENSYKNFMKKFHEYLLKI